MHHLRGQKNKGYLNKNDREQIFIQNEYTLTTFLSQRQERAFSEPSFIRVQLLPSLLAPLSPHGPVKGLQGQFPVTSSTGLQLWNHVGSLSQCPALPQRHEIGKRVRPGTVLKLPGCPQAPPQRRTSVSLSPPLRP